MENIPYPFGQWKSAYHDPLVFSHLEEPVFISNTSSDGAQVRG